jgi:predicted transcriptional regulator
MRNGSSLSLTVFLDEMRLVQIDAAKMWGVTQAAISQMCRGDREMVVVKNFDEDKDTTFYRLIEVKEIGVGSLPGK